MSHNDFELCAGSIIGSVHRSVFKNNQDAIAIVQNDNCMVGIVADGVSGCQHSEVGAHITSSILAGILADSVCEIELGQKLLDEVAYLTTLSLREVVKLMHISRAQAVDKYLVCTSIGFIITDETSLFFALGDGVVYVNGRRHELKNKIRDTPASLAYALVEPPEDASEEVEEMYQPEFRIIQEIPTAELEHFFIGSDGVEAIVDNAENRLPNRDELCGGPDQFWSDDQNFCDDQAVDVCLERMIGRGTRATSLLYDDTTLIAGRRKRHDEPTQEES